MDSDMLISSNHKFHSCEHSLIRTVNLFPISVQFLRFIQL